MPNLEPRVRRTPQNIQCLYNIDCRVHAVQAYPILSPQGASIFLYGHENGVTVVWRGGGRLKRGSKADPKSAPKNDAVMVLDSDSDDAAAVASSVSSAAFVDKPAFEDATAAEVSVEGFPPVQQTLDLALGTAALHVAVLPLAPMAAKDAEPSLLGEQMVFAVTCATNAVYVVTLPLTPPSHESKERLQLQASLLAGNAGRGAFGEVLLSLGGQTKPASGIALALAKQKTTAITSNGTVSAQPIHVIVAAHSREASGTLRLWDVTVGSKRTPSATTASLMDRPLEPFQTEYLPSPVTSVAFNPTQPSQLLVVSPQDAVRIFDYTMPAIPSDDAAEGPFPAQGSWLLSLYPPFARSQTMSAIRKPIVSAAWIAHGHAILALLADGQWGIWDVYSANGSASAFGRSAAAGTRRASLATFTLTGQIEGTTPLRNPVVSTRKSAEGEFVPMTPHTRRDALASAFSGKVEGLVALRGGVEVVQQRSVHGGSTSIETAVLWLGGADYIVAVIPDVARFCEAQLRGNSGSNLFSGARPARMVRLMDLNASLLGERCCGVSVVSQGSQPRRRNVDDEGDEDDEPDKSVLPSSKLPVEVLVQGENRLVIIRDSTEDASSSALTARLLTTKKRKTSESASTAIVVETRSRQPGAAALGGLRIGGAAGGVSKSLFDSSSRPSTAVAPQTPMAKASQTRAQPEPHTPFEDNADNVSFTQSMMRPPMQTPANSHRIAFAGDLSMAANATDDEDAANERNIEEEMLNIMEIDQALEAMEEHQGVGSQNVFFEGA